MTFIELISKESANDRMRILLTATFAGIANSALLIIISTSSQVPDQIGLQTFVAFALAILTYIFCARHTYHRTTSIVEAALQRIKIRVVEKIEQAELAGIERLGSSEIHDRLTENTTVISNSAGMISNVLQSLCILLFATLYLAWLSTAAFLIVGFLFFVSIRLYVSKEQVMSSYIKQLGQKRIDFLDVLTDLLTGFKEVKFSRARTREIHRDVMIQSEFLRDVTVKANHLFDDNVILANMTLFAVLGALVFVVPRHMSISGTTLVKFITGVMFIWGPLSVAVAGFPAYLRSNIALAQIETLEEKLDRALIEGTNQPEESTPWQGQLGPIEATHIEYQYAAQSGGDAFRIGPIDFSIAPGEIVFVVGGNGSGKSTFMKVITGLYPPTVGTLRVAGITVTEENVAAYREMISPIFSDFHLFTKTYGLKNISEQAVTELLSRMQLEGKTAFRDGRFTKRSLSTGQRKRLALIIALLEDRPLYVFDEWAADQDPEFRKYFYEELLPMLKQKGKAVIAVSHDDRYFHCADRVVTMEYGKIRSVEKWATD